MAMKIATTTLALCLLLLTGCATMQTDCAKVALTLRDACEQANLSDRQASAEWQRTHPLQKQPVDLTDKDGDARPYNQWVP
jgi:hypothetical protein